jgi:phosphorylcholine metabolism protein LicD
VRFFTAEVPYTAHRAVLTNLIRSYLSTLASLHLETWIAHGTLLGWYWNQHILPWDFDVDVQVSGATLAALATQYNQSRHTYAYTDAATGAPATQTYLLDVNPFATRVDRGRGENAIDARWIDVSTGMYVDITGLVERDPKNAPGVVSCKNFHGYRQEELFPLRESEFEGVPALVPYEYEKILVGEYQEKSLVVTEFEG